MLRIAASLVGVLAMAAVTPHALAAAKKHEAAAKPASPTTQSLGKSGAWAAYVSNDSTGRVCYLVGQPQKSEPAGLARKQPMAMVTHRPVEKIANVVSFVEGYPLKEESTAVLDIGNEKFELFTSGDSAWARTADLDRTVVAALAKGKRAVIKGAPPKGPATTDVYDLDGFPRALALIDKACGVEREKPKPQPVPAKHHKPKKSAGPTHHHHHA